jgi:hypothetical protein
LNQELRKALKTEKYPPGSDRRVIDWAKAEESGVKCAECGDEFAKTTECGSFCLFCYRKLPKCEVTGCHKPAMDVTRLRNKKVWIRSCREHYYDAALEKELENDYRILFSSHTNGITY